MVDGSSKDGIRNVAVANLLKIFEERIAPDALMIALSRRGRMILRILHAARISTPLVSLEFPPIPSVSHELRIKRTRFRNIIRSFDNRSSVRKHCEFMSLGREPEHERIVPHFAQ